MPVHPETERIESGTVVTSDNVSIAYDRYTSGRDSVIIICPGFFNSKNNKWMQRTVGLVSPSYDVIIFDFRGHGRSGGKFTWSAKEDLDVGAVVERAKEYGYKSIGIIAFSLGAAAAVNDASKMPGIDSMVLVSCPTSFRMIDFHFWEPEMFADLKDNFDCKWEGKGARTGNIFAPKVSPINSIKRLERTPVLFIHGGKDWIIKDHHSKDLYAAKPGVKEIRIIPDGLHAERLVEFHEEAMKRLITEWFSRTLVWYNKKI